MFNIAAHTLVPNYGNALLGGVQAGQDARRNILGNEKMLMEQKQGRERAHTDFFAKAAVQLENTPEAMRPQVYDRLQTMAVQQGLMSMSEVEPYSEDVMNQLQVFKYQAQDVKDLTTTKQQDRQYQLDQRKFNLEAKKFENELKTGGLDSKEIFDRETKLRREYADLSGEFIKQRDAYGRIEASADNPSAAGDLALIFNYMKVLDPGSTVREGEFATAQNAGSVPDRVWNAYNKVMRGERLAPEQRSDFVNRAGKLFNKAEVQHKQRTDQYTGLAERAGVNPKQVLVDMSLVKQGDKKTLPTGTVLNPDGTFTLPDGRKIRKKQ